MAIEDNSGRNFPSELCPCWEVVLLASGPPARVDLKARLRKKIARETGGETRGRGGRRRKLETAITIASTKWDRHDAVDADIKSCAAWVDHLRAERLKSHDDLRTHLRELQQLNASDDVRVTLLKKLKRAQEAIYGNERARWGISVLAALLEMDVESVKRMRRRPRSVHYVSTDLNALAELQGSDLQEEFHEWRRQKHEDGVAEK